MNGMLVMDDVIERKTRNGNGDVKLKSMSVKGAYGYKGVLLQFILSPDLH